MYQQKLARVMVGNTGPGRNLKRGTLPKGERTPRPGEIPGEAQTQESTDQTFRLIPERLRTDSERDQTPEAGSSGLVSPGRDRADPVPRTVAGNGTRGLGSERSLTSLGRERSVG